MKRGLSWMLRLGLVAVAAVYAAVLLTLQFRLEKQSEKNGVNVLSSAPIIRLSAPQGQLEAGHQIYLKEAPHPSRQKPRQKNPNVFNRTAYARPSSSYLIEPSDLWETQAFSVLPEWIRDYFRWHKEMRLQLVECHLPFVQYKMRRVC
jgi:hypothetical protein